MSYVLDQARLPLTVCTVTISAVRVIFPQTGSFLRARTVSLIHLCILRLMQHLAIAGT